MANMLRANQGARAICKPKDLIVYRDCNHSVLPSVSVVDSCQAFASGGPIGSMESFQCQFCHCHQNVHRWLDVNNHQIAPPPAQQQTVTQRDVKPEVSSNTTNANRLGRINAQIFDSLAVSIELAESIMARATENWVNCNNKDVGNKSKKSWDEHVAEEYEKEQPQILANQLELTLNMRSQNGKNKKIKKDEDEKPDGFELYIKTKSKAIKKLQIAQAENNVFGQSYYPN